MDVSRGRRVVSVVFGRWTRSSLQGRGQGWGLEVGSPASLPTKAEPSIPFGDPWRRSFLSERWIRDSDSSCTPMPTTTTNMRG